MKIRLLTVAICAVAVIAIALAAGCGGSGSGGSQSASASPEEFVRRVTTEFSRGQSGRLWAELLPADQRVVPRARFVECQPNEGWRLKGFKVLETFSDPVSVGASLLPAKAVSVQVTSDEGVTTATMHAVSANGTWHWVLQPSDRAAYKSGRCPRSG